jgi:hypothetical protein
MRTKNKLQIGGSWFKDENGRTLILRGVNLGGSSKVPYPHGATHVREGFYEHRDVSFVGRPFPLEEADEHLRRLRHWGFAFVRLLVTWEAVEHAGPGIYDQEYLEYLYEVARRAGEHGIDLFIDPHQDVWSRLSGGDGAPGWTFEAAGLDVTRFSETGAAIVHAVHGDPLPHLSWPTNETKLAAATMFSLFFGGNDFAPRAMVDGEPIQPFLQRHYLAAMEQVARRLQGLGNVVGYDTLNEPSPGYIGWPDLSVHEGLLRLGDSPTPFQSMALGAGYPQQVEIWSLGLRGPRRRAERLLNAAGVSTWLEGHPDIWREHGVWDVDSRGQPRLLRPDHFAQVDGRPVDFGADYLRPFLEKYARTIRAVDPEAILFLEAPPRSAPLHWDLERVPRVVHAGHWYDGLTLATKAYIPNMGADFLSARLVVGRRRVRRSFVKQLANYRLEAAEHLGGAPTVIGEFGIPFDLRGGRAYRTGDFSGQIQALDDTFQALEANLLSGTLWNYTADNDNERGDQWNGEDFSIFSRDQQEDPGDLDSGGRALESAVRPYARAVAGEPLEMAYNPGRRVFDFTFRHDAAIQAPTEIYVPNLHYPDGYEVEVSDGTYTADREAQVLVYHHGDALAVHHFRLRPAKGHPRKGRRGRS